MIGGVEWTLPVHVGHIVWRLRLSTCLNPVHHCRSLGTNKEDVNLKSFNRGSEAKFEPSGEKSESSRT